MVAKSSVSAAIVPHADFFFDKYQLDIVGSLNEQAPLPNRESDDRASVFSQDETSSCSSAGDAHEVDGVVSCSLASQSLKWNADREGQGRSLGLNT